MINGCDVSAAAVIFFKNYSVTTSIPFSAKYFAAPAWKGTVIPLVAFSRLNSAPFAFSAVIASILLKIAAVRLYTSSSVALALTIRVALTVTVVTSAS